jgi:RNAse (barnase) inhibitor barstar
MEGRLQQQRMVYEAFAIQLGLPDYFGRNLDACGIDGG